MIKKIAIIIILILSITSTVNAQYIGEYYGDALFSTNRGPIWIRNANGSTGAAITSRISNIITATTAEGTVVRSATEVTVRNTAGTLAKVGMLSTIGKLAGSGLLAGVAVGGLLVAGEKAIDYLLAQGLPEDELHMSTQYTDGRIYSWQSGGLEQPCPTSGTNPFTGQSQEAAYIGGFENLSDAATAAAAAVGNPPCGSRDVCGGNHGSCPNGGPQCMKSLQWKGNIDTQEMNFAYGNYGVCNFQPAPKIEVPATQTQLTNAANNGYDNAPTEWQKNLIDVLKKIDESLNDPDSKIRNNPYVSYPGLLSGYLNTMDQEDLTNLEQTIDPALNPTGTGTMTPQDQIDQAKEEQTEKYKKELLDTLKSPSTDTGAANAIKEANDAAAGEVLAPLGDLPAQETAGDHESIVPIVETFVDGLNALPIVSFFNDLKDNVTFAGDCNFSLSMPNPMNNTVNTVHLSLCSYQPTFAFMGSCLLLITGVRYLMYLFEG